MPRFFIDAGDIRNGSIMLCREDTRHITVLRHKPGDEIILCDGACTDYICRITRIEKEHTALEVVDSRRSLGEPDIHITLYQGLTKGGKLELVIQKCVELGVCNIVPVITSRSIPRQNSTNAKRARWQEISKSAAMQCGRGIVPVVHETMDMKSALKHTAALDSAFVAHEAAGLEPLKNVFKSRCGQSYGVFIGPEGGFSNEEIDMCIEYGVLPVSLGDRVLRTETAGFVSLIIMLYL